MQAQSPLGSGERMGIDRKLLAESSEDRKKTARSPAGE